jgi:hypothetical protein
MKQLGNIILLHPEKEASVIYGTYCQYFLLQRACRKSNYKQIQPEYSAVSCAKNVLSN